MPTATTPRASARKLRLCLNGVTPSAFARPSAADTKRPPSGNCTLTYTNPRVGYTVLGAEYLQSELSALDASGQIQSFLRDPSSLGQTINAERSVAFNAGFDATLAPDLAWRVNLYHNEVRELIDTQPVATKTNGQQVFSYFNRGSVFTRGVETQLSWRPVSASVPRCLTRFWMPATETCSMTCAQGESIAETTTAATNACRPATTAG